MISTFRSLIDRSAPQSASRALAIWAGGAFIAAMVAVSTSITYRIWTAGDVGTGACAALGCVSAPLAALIASIYRVAPGHAALDASRAGAVLDAPAPIEGGR